MGWDIQTIGHHNLNVRDVVTVAKQLSERLDINIDFRYKNEYLFSEKDKVVRCNYNSEWVSLGHIIRHPEKGLYHLDDTLYCKKEILSICSIKGIEPIMDDNVFWIEEGSIFYQLEDWEEEPLGDLYYLDVYQESFLMSLHYDPGRWYGFYRFFNDSEYTRHDLDTLSDYRKRLRGIARALGCDYLYLYSNQGPSSMIDSKLSNTWNEIEAYIKSLSWIDAYYEIDIDPGQNDKKDDRAAARSSFRLMDIPSFITAEKPDRSKYYSDIFIDDFSDLEQG